MENKTFKKILNDSLISLNFSKKGNSFYSKRKDVIIVIGLQKSNYGNGYYVNLGYTIINLKPTIEIPREIDGDVRARFSLKKHGRELDYYDLDELQEDDYLYLIGQLKENLNKYVDPVNSVEELKALLQKNPVMLYQTKLAAKKFLNF